MPHLSPTTLTTDEQRLILGATAGNVRDHTIVSLALGTGQAERRGVRMPSLFHDMIYGGSILIPLFVAVTFIPLR